MPTRSLTAAAVACIKPPAKGQADHFDRGYPGLALRVSYGGARSRVYFYRLHGVVWSYAALRSYMRPSRADAIAMIMLPNTIAEKAKAIGWGESEKFPDNCLSRSI